jgi:hypothetical protein
MKINQLAVHSTRSARPRSTLRPQKREMAGCRRCDGEGKTYTSLHFPQNTMTERNQAWAAAPLEKDLMAASSSCWISKRVSSCVSLRRFWTWGVGLRSLSSAL